MGESIQITLSVSRVAVLRSTAQIFPFPRNKLYTTHTLKFNISVQKYFHVGAKISRRVRFKIATRTSIIVQASSI